MHGLLGAEPPARGDGEGRGVPEADYVPECSCSQWVLGKGLWTSGPSMRLRFPDPRTPWCRPQLHWPARPGRAAAEAPPCPAECQMMVLLDLTRSYESMRRQAERSENKRCLGPCTGLGRPPAPTPGGAGGPGLMGVLRGLWGPECPCTPGQGPGICLQPLPWRSWGRGCSGRRRAAPAAEQRPACPPEARWDWARGQRAGRRGGVPWLQSAPRLVHPRPVWAPKVAEQGPVS